MYLVLGSSDASTLGPNNVLFPGAKTGSGESRDPPPRLGEGAPPEARVYDPILVSTRTKHCVNFGP